MRENGQKTLAPIASQREARKAEKPPC